jgi:dTDP-glucose 4,6-dehydratase
VGCGAKANIDIVKLIIKQFGQTSDLIEYVKDRPGHDRRYAIDNTKITTELGWRPAYTFEDGLRETISWYIENENWLDGVINGSYKDYYRETYG